MNKNFIVLMFLVVLGGNILALVPNIAPIPLEHGAHRIGKRTDVDMQHWREYGLGQFIHWGVYAIPGGHWNGKTYNGAAEWIRSWKEMPKAAYDSLYMQFNPSAFNANDWAKKAQKMGAKYVIITTKHHDGFCIWPSKYTDYTIKNTPYQKDILKQLVDEYNKNGIDVYLYFSIIDWNHPGYRSVIKSKEDSAAYERFKQFTRNQIVELLTNYPTTKGLWFDGTWDKAWVNQAKFADELDAELRDLHPGLIIGSRFRPDEYGKRGTDSNGNLLGDYEQGWERDLPTKIEDVHGNDWEGVMTIPENQWGYHSEWKGYVKSSFNLIEMLVKSVSLNGNFVLNFGPDGKGNIRPEESKIAKEIGDWMKINSEAIYGCAFVDLKKQDWGYYTRKNNRIYLTIVNRPLNNRLSVEIPKAGIYPQKAYFLGNKKEIKIIDGARTKQNNRLYFLSIPENYKSKQPFVIVLEIEEKN
jgi:alpha-L-fucosidase